MISPARKLLGIGTALLLAGAMSVTALWWSRGPAEDPAEQGAATQQAAQTRGARDARYQAWLQEQVRRALSRLPYESVFDYLAFRTEGDRVILLGAVHRPTLRSDAEAAVRRIEGVEDVANQIEVLPLSTFDDQLRVALYRSIYGQSALSRYGMAPIGSIRIIVRNGHVTLEGVVANETDRNIANIQAHTVPGVFSVSNNLRIERRAG
jgi:hyperosmotically inducible periplasmic protein